MDVTFRSPVAVNAVGISGAPVHHSCCGVGNNLKRCHNTADRALTDPEVVSCGAGDAQVPVCGVCYRFVMRCARKDRQPHKKCAEAPSKRCRTRLDHFILPPHTRFVFYDATTPGGQGLRRLVHAAEAAVSGIAGSPAKAAEPLLLLGDRWGQHGVFRVQDDDHDDGHGFSMGSHQMYSQGDVCMTGDYGRRATEASC